MEAVDRWSAACGASAEPTACESPRHAALSLNVVLCVVASTCFWYLLQYRILTAPFWPLKFMGVSLGTLLATACIMVTAVLLGLLGPRISALLSRAPLVAAAGMIAGLAMGAGTLIAAGSPGPGVPPVLLICMAGEAVGFCTVFLAWCQAWSFEATRRGLSGVLLDHLAAVACSIAISQIEPLTVVGGVSVFDAAVLPVAAGCFVWWGRRCTGGAQAWYCQVNGRPRVDWRSDNPHRMRDGLWLGTVVCAFLFAGLLSYLPRFNDMAVVLEGKHPITIGFTVAFLVPLILACLQIGKTDGTGRHAVMLALLVAALVVLVAFFLLTLSVSSALAIQYGLARFVRRASRIVTFLFLLLFVYRVGLCSVRCFALAFLVPMCAPKVTVYVAALAIPDAAAFSVSQVLVFALAMAVTICLVVALFLNFDGGVVRQMAGVREVDKSIQAPTDPWDVCRRLGVEAGLTDRETDILCLLSRGYSGAKVCDELGISRGTLNTHSTSIYRKLDIHSKQELIDFVNDRTPA